MRCWRNKRKLLTGAPAELGGLCAQLYDAWDKILTDLDESHYGGDSIYRERLKTVRVHYTDVAAKKTETHSEEHWIKCAGSVFPCVEKDMGMAIAHKDAGHFDSEAQTVPQPAGLFVYRAAGGWFESVWPLDKRSYGHSVWTWLPEYLILRELLWNHSYQPVVMGDYRAYRMAQQRGTSYYGQRTPDAPPKYGTHGTFTQSHYAGSRYMQSGGGYRGSAYASSGSGATPTARRARRVLAAVVVRMAQGNGLDGKRDRHRWGSDLGGLRAADFDRVGEGLDDGARIKTR